MIAVCCRVTRSFLHLSRFPGSSVSRHPSPCHATPLCALTLHCSLYLCPPTSCVSTSTQPQTLHPHSPLATTAPAVAVQPSCSRTQASTSSPVRAATPRPLVESLTISLSASASLYAPNGSALVHFDGAPYIPSHRVVIFAPIGARAFNPDHALPAPPSSFVDPTQSILLGGNALPPSGTQSLKSNKL